MWSPQFTFEGYQSGRTLQSDSQFGFVSSLPAKQRENIMSLAIHRPISRILAICVITSIDKVKLPCVWTTKTLIPLKCILIRVYLLHESALLASKRMRLKIQKGMPPVLKILGFNVKY